MNDFPIEERISISSIEFRSESGITELVRLKAGKDYNSFVLEISQLTVDYCHRILNNSINSVPKIYFKMLLEDKSKERLERVEKAKSVLEKIAKKELVSPCEIDNGINFFKELIQKCDEYVRNYS